MKQKFVNLILPLLFFRLERVLKRLKPPFLGEDESLKEELLRQGFHPAL